MVAIRHSDESSQSAIEQVALGGRRDTDEGESPGDENQRRDRTPGFGTTALSGIAPIEQNAD
jgi:hypothetical protein